MRSLLAAAGLAIAILTVAATPASAADDNGPKPTDVIHGVSCTNIEQIGVGGAATADGVVALKVWQYKGWCRGSWMRFTYARVTQDFRDKPWGYRGHTWMEVVHTGPEFVGEFVTTWNDWGFYSYPVDLSSKCSRGKAQFAYIKNGVNLVSDVAVTNGHGPGC